jgi:hypothetical protein
LFARALKSKLNHLTGFDVKLQLRIAAADVKLGRFPALTPHCATDKIIVRPRLRLGDDRGRSLVFLNRIRSRLAGSRAGRVRVPPRLRQRQTIGVQHTVGPTGSRIRHRTSSRPISARPPKRSPDLISGSFKARFRAGSRPTRKQSRA